MTGTPICLTGDELRESLADQLPDSGAWAFEAAYEQSDPPRMLCARDTAEYYAEQLTIVQAGERKEAVGSKFEARDNEVYVW